MVVTKTSSGSHAPAWEQMPTLQRRVIRRAAGAAGLHSHAVAWERAEIEAESLAPEEAA